jgi:hypothetical protein
MKVNELRIGNLVDEINRNGKVHLPAGLVRKVGRISFFEVELYYPFEPFATQVEPTPTKIADLSPIRLTSEWLQKLGFILYNDGNEDQYYRDFGDYPNHMTIRLVPSRDGGWNVAYFTRAHIRFVHQLQNLYFSLTNEELEYEP